MLFFIIFLAGVLSGLRAFMALVVVSWSARLHRLHLEATPLAFLGYVATPFVATLLSLGELVTDQLPSTPSRKVAKQFIPRLLLGGTAGAAIGLAHGALVLPILISLIGVVTGTYGGAALRTFLARTFRTDRPAAFLEDLLAIALAGVLFVCL
jgi:uncharacterized membrane protein